MANFECKIKISTHIFHLLNAIVTRLLSTFVYVSTSMAILLPASNYTLCEYLATLEKTIRSRIKQRFNEQWPETFVKLLRI